MAGTHGAPESGDGRTTARNALPARDVGDTAPGRVPRLLRPGAWIVALVIAGVAVFAVNRAVDGHASLIHGDGEGLWMWARSMLLDGDVDFRNDFEGIGPFPSGDTTTPDGMPANKYPVGLSIVAAAPGAVALAVERGFGLDPGPRPGCGPVFQWTVAVSLLVAGAAGLAVMLRRVESRVRDASPWDLREPRGSARLRAMGTRGTGTAALAAAILVGGTALVEFATRLVSYTHLVEVALVGVVWVLVDAPLRGWRWMWAGFLGALLVVIRPMDVLLVPWFVAWAAHRGARARARDVVAACAGAAVPLAIQAAANVSHWGVLFPEPYPGESFTWSGIHPLRLLFSPHHGWLAWHPVHLLLLAGLAASRRAWFERPRGRAVWGAAVAAVVGHVALLSAWHGWDGGFGFGNRYFLALSPVLVVTAVPAWERVRAGAARRVVVACVAVCVAWNGWLWMGHTIAATPAHPDPDLIESAAWWRADGPATTVERLDAVRRRVVGDGADGR